MAHSTRTLIHGATVALGLLLASLGALANDLKSVRVSMGADGGQVVRIGLSEVLKTPPLHFTTSNPHRIVLDFPGLQNPQGRLSEVVDAGVVHAYNVAQTADRTRVVLDLNGPAAYDLRQEGNVLLVALRGADVGAGQQVAPAHFDGAGAGHSIRDVAFRRGKKGEGRIEIALSEPGVGVDIKQKGQTIQVDFLDTSLPASLRRRLDVSDFATPAQAVETQPQGRNTRMTVALAGKWDFFAYQTGKEFILEVTPLEAVDKTPGRKRYEGERLSLDFQNVDVRSVLKVIADFTGQNIVAAESVSGSITLRLKDVPWDQALDIILLSKGLDKRENGNVIWVAPSKDLMEKEKQRQEAADVEELQTEIIRLNYMRAPDAYAILTGKSITSVQAGEKVTCSATAVGVGGRTETASGSTGSATAAGPNSMISKRGTVNFDLKTNSVLVQDTQARLDKIRALLTEIDVPARQVMIEARVVVADDSFSRTLGARLALATKLGNDAAISTGSATADAARLSTADLTMPGTYNVNLGANPNVGLPGVLGLSIIEGAGNAILGLELQALEADNRGKIVSSRAWSPRTRCLL